MALFISLLYKQNRGTQYNLILVKISINGIRLDIFDPKIGSAAPMSKKLLSEWSV
jgi:hypothetical protein